jgi:hypothetical protein
MYTVNVYIVEANCVATDMLSLEALSLIDSLRLFKH